jgi:hypothetical protein
MQQARLREGLPVSDDQNRSLLLSFHPQVACPGSRSIAISVYRASACTYVQLWFETIIRTESP